MKKVTFDTVVFKQKGCFLFSGVEEIFDDDGVHFKTNNFRTCCDASRLHRVDDCPEWLKDCAGSLDCLMIVDIDGIVTEGITGCVNYRIDLDTKEIETQIVKYLCRDSQIHIDTGEWHPIDDESLPDDNGRLFVTQVNAL